MQAIVNHPTLGKVVYEEGFWSGKRTISINGVQLTSQSKKIFHYVEDGERKTVTVEGNYLHGMRLCIGDEEIEVVSAPKPLEIVCSVLIVMAILILGNATRFFVGGALGGAISGAMAITNLFLMKKGKTTGIKLLIWVGMLAATLLICFLLALIIVSLMV